MDNIEIIVNTGEVKLYNKDNDYILELWGASTKHPDYCKTLSSYENSHEDILRDCRTIYERLFYFLTYVSSEMLWISTSKELLEIALGLLNR